VGKVKRILLIVTKLELGGAQQIVLSTAKALVKKGFEVEIATTPGILMDEALSIAGCRIRIIPHMERTPSPLKDLMAFLELLSLMRIRRYHLVHTHGSKAGILGRIAAWVYRVPVVIHTYHGFSFHGYQPWYERWLYVALERIAAKVSTRLIAVSEATMRKGIAYGIGDPSKYIVIRGGTRISDFITAYLSVDRRGKRMELGLSPDRPVVCMVACFKPQKSPLDFLEMAHIVSSEVPEAQFLMVGDGVLRPAIERRARELGLEGRLFLAGWRWDVPEIMASIDVLVLTSLWEGLPLVIPQAMACGKPVVATRVDGSEEAVVDGETGFLVRPRDVEGAARAVIRLLRDPELARRMGEKGFSLAPSFDEEQMIAKEIRLYEELLGEEAI
jgi:glycosyltransferase involved in cell wall biosynthesis